MNKRHVLAIVAALAAPTSALAADPYQGDYVVPDSPPMVEDVPTGVVAPAVPHAPPPVYAVPPRYYAPPPGYGYYPR